MLEVSMLQFFSVGIGGFLGACLRFIISKKFSAYDNFPFGTLISNAVAGLLIGIFIGIEREYIDLPKQLKLLLVTGFLGGLSTFSTFSLETVIYIENGSFLKAGLNVFLNVAVSFLCVFLGLMLVRCVFRTEK
jgi:CrcB protein